MSRSSSMAENTVSNSLPPSSAQSKVTVGGSSTASGGAGGMHHHHHHHHLHHHNHHKSMDMGGSGKAGGGSKHHTNVIHRTTSESLRLGGGGTGSGSSMNNSVSGSGGGSTMGTGGGGGNGNIGSNENSVSSSMLNSSTSANSISRKSASSSTSGGGGAGHGGAGGGIGGAAGPGGKTSSFTITSVIVGTGKHSADNGDDSADDLDESHTDDNSRITDFENETPSFSEDTFSKEDVFFTNAIGSVPVIPTSSQYGLAIVAPNDRTHGGEVLADAMHVSVTDGGINIMGHGKGEMSDGKELHHRNERFKVVKIESTEPFKRGRWVCMDYLDHTTLQQPKEISTGAEGNEATGGTNASVTTQDSGVGMNDNASFAPSDGTMNSEMPSMDYHPNAVSSSPVVVGSSVAASTSTTTASNVSSALHGMLNNESPGQSLNLPLAGGNASGGGGAGAAGTGGNTTTSHVQSNTTAQGGGNVGGGAGIPHSLPQSQLQNALAGQQPQQPNAAYSQGQQGQSQYYPHTMTNLADLNQQSVSNPQAHQHHQHGATLPSNMQIHPQPQPPQQQQPSNNAVSSSNILPPLVAPIPTSQEMNIIINNPTIQSSFPSPHQQFKPQQPQQTASQTNSPVVVPTSLLDNNTTVTGAAGETVPLNNATAGTAILSPSTGTGNAVSAMSTTGGGSAHDTAGSVSIVTDPLMNSSPSATSSPVTSSAQIIPQPTTFAPPPGAGASAVSIGDPSSTVAQNTTTAPNSVTSGSNNTAVGGSTTTNGTNCVVAAGSPSSTGAIGSASSIAVAGSSGTDPLSSEAKLLSAVSGVTAATVAGDGEDPEKATAEDGESSSGLQAQQQSQQQPLQSLPSAKQQQQQQLGANAFPDANASNDNFQNASLDRGVMLAALQPQIAQQSPQMPQQQQPPQQYQQQYHAPLYNDNAEKLSKAYSLPPSMSAAAKESLRKELAQSRLEQQQQQHPAARKFQPVARAFNVVITSSSPAGTTNPTSTTHASGQANTSNIYTDIALGKSIQNLMKPTPILATAVSNRLAGGSLTRSIGALGSCRELPEGTPAQEATGYCRTASSLLGNFTGSNSVSTCTATHPHRCVQDLIKEELGGHRLSKAGSMINMSTDSDLFTAGGSQSHPASGRSSPAFMQGTTPVGSPPRFLNTLGPSYSGGGSARVSRAPSPSVLHASGGGEHASASGTSAVAIDNKIEQAMDLVKSHLMFAVREEVEVLKERISELMDRINQLEYENNILKANASQETLAQLTSGGSNVTTAPAVAAPAQQQVTSAPTANAGSTKVPTSSANPANGSVS